MTLTCLSRLCTWRTRLGRQSQKGLGGATGTSRMGGSTQFSERMRTPTRTICYVGLLALGAVVATLALYRAQPAVSTGDLGSVAILAAIALLAEALTFEVSDYQLSTIASMPYLAVVLLAPCWAGVLAIAATKVLTLRRIKSDALLKVTFNICQAALALALSCLAYRGFGGVPFPSVQAPSFASLTAMAWRPGIAADLAISITNSVAFAGVIAISAGKRLSQVWKRDLVAGAIGTAFQGPLVFMFAWLFVTQGPMAGLALIGAMLLVRWGQVRNAQLMRMNEELIDLMISSMEAQSRYTSGHSKRVQHMATFIAKQILQLQDRDVDRVSRAALLHDIGKIGEKYTFVLNKDGPLTNDERLLMQQHSVDGATLLARMSTFGDIVPLVRHHHENWDGSGYPDGLSGDSIPLPSRIIMFADTIDAMTSSRPYRRALDQEAVRSEIFKLRGRQFDPKIADVLLKSERWDELFVAHPFRLIRGSGATPARAVAVSGSQRSFVEGE